MDVTPAGAAGVDAWPLLLWLDQVLERAGLRVAAIHGLTDPEAGHQPSLHLERRPAASADRAQPARQAEANSFVAKGSPPEQLCAAVWAAWRSS